MKRLFNRSGGPPSYGSTASSTSPSQLPSLVPKLPQPAARSSSPLLGTSPRRDRVRNYDLEDLMEVDEEATEVHELVDIPYSILLRNYSLVPISAFLFLFSLILVITLAWPPPSSRGPHLPSLLVGASAWIISYALRLPIFAFTTCFNYYANAFTLALSTVLSIALEEALRLCSIILLGLQLDASPESDDDGSPTGSPGWPMTGDEAFRKTVYVAAGWAVVEVCWSVAQGYEQLSVYKDLLPRSSSSRWLPFSNAGRILGSRLNNGASSPAPSDSSQPESVSHRYVHAALQKSSPTTAYANRLSQHQLENRNGINGEMDEGSGGEDDLDAQVRELINFQTRTELEMVYGVPPPNIPVFISVLQRMDSILLTFGLTLAISSAYLSAIYPIPSATTLFPVSTLSDLSTYSSSTSSTIDIVRRLLPTYAAVTVIHACLALMWTELLPRIGVHTASYTALLVSLATFFAGLGVWGALS